MMGRRSKIWFVVAVLFTLINLAGAAMAVYAGEAQHTALHVVLSLIGIAAVRGLAPWRTPSQADRAVAGPTGEVADRLTNLEQSIDAVAIEVERVGEAQRFMTRILREKPPEK
jgi:hypothetical protein